MFEEKLELETRTMEDYTVQGWINLFGQRVSVDMIVYVNETDYDPTTDHMEWEEDVCITEIFSENHTDLLDAFTEKVILNKLKAN